MLTDEEMEGLIKNLDDDSWKVLAEHNIKLAYAVSNTFSNSGIEGDELSSIALYALAKAAKKFDPNLGYEFSTFAIPTIRNEILYEIWNRRNHPYPSISINKRVELGDNEHELGEIIPDGYQLDSDVICRFLINQVFYKQNNLKQKVIALYFGGERQEYVARQCGISQLYASRIIRDFMKNIEKELQGERSCMNMVRKDLENLVDKELNAANQRFPMFRSSHEGCAVILEELQEAQDEMSGCNAQFNWLWDATKRNIDHPFPLYAMMLRDTAINLACEAVQLAAMAQKIVDSQKLWEEKPDGKD